MDDPLEIFGVLNRYGVEYLVIGGHAVAYHGYVRTTEDFDIVAKPNRGNKKKLFDALDSINARWITDEIDPGTGIEKTRRVTLGFVETNQLMMLCTDKGFIDIFFYIPSFPETPVEKLFETAERFKKMLFVSLDWLIKMKKAAGRHKDLADVEELEKMVEK